MTLWARFSFITSLNAFFPQHNASYGPPRRLSPRSPHNNQPIPHLLVLVLLAIDTLQPTTMKVTPSQTPPSQELLPEPG